MTTPQSITFAILGATLILFVWGHWRHDVVAHAAPARGGAFGDLAPRDAGHQSNTLVMEPGGYRFGDYWRVGLPLEALIVAVAMPTILLVWPM